MAMYHFQALPTLLVVRVLAVTMLTIVGGYLMADPLPPQVNAQDPPAGSFAEFQTIMDAVSTMMADNDLTQIPNPVAANSFPCTTGTQDMNKYPDTATLNTAKTDPTSGDVFTTSDGGGYLLFGHDITADASVTSLVNYVSSQFTTFCYRVTNDGVVTQFNTPGTELPPPPTLQSLAVSPSSATVLVAGTLQFTATGTFSDASTQDLTTTATWSSSDTGVVSMTSSGLATGVGGGTVTITAIQDTISDTATLTVVIPAPVPSLTQWGLIAMAVFMAAALLWQLRRRHTNGIPSGVPSHPLDHSKL